jgi:hypothetical protein
MRMDQPRVTVDWEAVDWGRVDEAVLAIMLLGLHDDWRTWKGIDWEVLNRLHEKGLITDPKSKAKSVIFTEEGRTGGSLAQAERVLWDRNLYVLG